MSAIKQRSPTFLAPGTGFVEDNFSSDGVGGVEGVGRDGSGGNASDAERQMKLRSLARHSPPAWRPGSQQAADGRLGTPAIKETKRLA